MKLRTLHNIFIEIKTNKILGRIFLIMKFTKLFFDSRLIPLMKLTMHKREVYKLNRFFRERFFANV